jgi:LytR cell envelope-related transcriptional attenuator
MHLTDRIGPALGSIKVVVDHVGPILGIVAFVALAILAFLLFQEARELRRLREWAGRAPERAAEAADAELAAADAREEAASGPPPSRWQRFKGRLGATRARIAAGFGPRWQELDRRSPVDPRILAVLLAAVIAAAVVTSGFGLIGSGSKGGAKQAKGSAHLRVAVLNGTQEPGVPAVSNLASKVANQVVKPHGYRPGPVTNAPVSVPKTVIMFRAGHGPDAETLAKAVKPKLGRTPTHTMTGTVEGAAGKARLALVLGLDDSSFGQ